MDAVITSFFSGFPILIGHFALTVAILGIGVAIYMWLTPYHELKLIKAGNTAAAISLSGAIVGLAGALSATKMAQAWANQAAKSAFARSASNPAHTRSRGAHDGDTMAPWNLMSDWVDGYKYHVDVRRQWSSLQPTWTDLMMWAVMTNEEALVRQLWARSHDPLRAALMASQLCRKLSSLPHLRADQRDLIRQSEALEDMALSLLDTIAEPQRAVPLIAMIPCVGHGVPLWAHSVLDSAAGDDGK